MKRLLMGFITVGIAITLTGCKKKKLSFDLKGKGICIGTGYERYEWDEKNNKWKPYMKLERIYDDNNKKLFDLSYIWYKKNKWTHLEDKDEYVYDSNGLLVKKLESYDYSYNTINENYRIEEYEYEGNKLTKMTEKSKTNQIWTTETYSYDTNGNLISVITSNKPGATSYKREYTYNSSNLKTKTLYYEYDSKTNSYKDPIDEEIYEYDSNNKLITYYKKNTTGISEVYFNSEYKEVTTYDNNKKIETIGYTIKDGTTTERAKFTYDYLDNGTLKSTTVSVCLDNEWALWYKVVYFTTIYND